MREKNELPDAIIRRAIHANRGRERVKGREAQGRERGREGESWSQGIVKQVKETREPLVHLFREEKAKNE